MKSSPNDSSASGRLLLTLRNTCAIALVATVAVATSSTSGATSQPAGETPPNITIIQTAAAVQGECLPRSQALSYATNNTPTAFTLTVTASAPLCDPVTDAGAVIYQMPGAGVAWPQELLGVQRFTISQAGVITIAFTKTCVPVQFDAITGATPQTISPLEAWHGPLLFPLDTNTSYQHWGSTCVEPATTLAATTTSTSSTTAPVTTTTASTTTAPSATTSSTTTTTAALSASTSTTSPSEVLGATGSPASGVLGESASRSPASARANGANLAVTGATSFGVTLFALALLTVGAAALTLRRRR